MYFRCSIKDWGEESKEIDQKTLAKILMRSKTSFGVFFQVRCMRQGAQGWCTGMTLKDGMGREVGERVRMGTHVHPWLINVNVWQNHYNIVK